jgi:hypothetical protein
MSPNGDFCETANPSDGRRRERLSSPCRSPETFPVVKSQKEKFLSIETKKPFLFEKWVLNSPPDHIAHPMNGERV